MTIEMNTKTILVHENVIIASRWKAHLHGLTGLMEVVPLLCDEAIVHVSGMQSSSKGRECNITVCSASEHMVKDDFACCK